MGRGQLRVGRRSSARTPRRSRRSRRSAQSLPNLRFIDRDRRRAATSPTRSRSTRSAPAGASATRPSWPSARESVGPDDPYTFIYTSGTTGPPKGCVLLHRNYRSVLDMINERGLLGAEGDLVYLFLPLAHAFALLIQLGAVDTGDDRRLLRRRREADHPRADAGQADLPAVGAAHLREALHARPGPDPGAGDRGDQRRSAGRSSDLEHHGEPVPQELTDRWTAPIEGDEQGRSLAQIAQFVQGLFGGNLREAVTGAAPIASEILRFFYGAGVPVMEGYGMTETATVATTSTPEDAQVRLRRPAAAGRRGEDRRGRRDPHQGRQHLQRLLEERRRQLRLDRRRLAAHRRRRLGRRGRLRLHHRPQEGHHHHRRRQEPDAGEPRERPQADPLDQPGRHARRPAAVPGDADHARRGGDGPVGDVPGDRGHLAGRARRAPAGDRADPGRAGHAPTRSTRRSSRSRSSSSSTTTSPRRPAS